MNVFGLALWEWLVLAAHAGFILLISLWIRWRYIQKRVALKQLLLLSFAFLLAAFFAREGRLIPFLAIILLDRVVGYLLRWALKKHQLVAEANRNRFGEILEGFASQWYLLEQAVADDQPLISPELVKYPYVDWWLLWREVVNLVAQGGTYLLFRWIWAQP